MYQVTFVKHGSIRVSPGTTLLEAARVLGLPVSAPCGGHGTCGKCNVLVNGETVSACRHQVFADTTVVLPDPEQLNIVTCGPKLSLQPDSRKDGYLIAVDIGTTTVACSLLSPSGEELAVQSMRNPQCAYGADVVSRIQWALKEGSEPLTRAIREGITQLIQGCCDRAGITPEKIHTVSVVGNSCMQQLFLGIPVDNLATVPFAPVITEAKAENAEPLLPCLPNAQLLTVPDIGGFVGADTVSCILAAAMAKTRDTVLMVDIGTNGEIVLAHRGKLAACAAAAGPALEGACIRFGMGGAVGAIDHVWLEEGRVQCSVIGGGTAKGICGSGIIDAVAVMLEAKLLNHRGRIQGAEEFALRDGIFLTQKDVRQVQLAKGAIAAGIHLLCAHFGITPADIRQVVLAGAFGSYMKSESACRIGLLPPELSGRIITGGNLALSGAKMLAADRSLLEAAESLVAQVHCMNLGENPAFSRAFAKCMGFCE